MSDSLEKNAEASDVLPRPDLNPLVNPVLEHNLGRWAEVYFTSPPEKREQAIIDLLLELQRTSALEPGHEAEPAAPTSPQESAPLLGIVCPSCHFENVARQRFCGDCGVSLQSNRTPLSAEPQPEPVEVSPLPEPPRITLAEDPVEAEGDVRWLRQRAFSQWDETDAPKHRGRNLLLAVFALTAVFGAFAYQRWLSSDRSIRSLPANASIPSAASDQLPAPGESIARLTPEKPSALEKTPIQAHNRTPERRLPSPQRLASTENPASPEDGAQELLLARQNLDGKNGAARNSTQAAKLLWKAVGKQNVQASLLLSDLYARGDGVAKSCDQARLLLVAAARKGTSAAAEQLHRLESSGCR